MNLKSKLFLKNRTGVFNKGVSYKAESDPCQIKQAN